ncbi:MAG: ketoacyl-ACP synthase III [Flavobacteriales bacterium]|nr:ketoacyl-ACP synthase III [Bdellovibrionales bacterium]MCB9361269.1 ketoacyl-ACP synthase III [Flavobacteriales bacterium]
MALFKVDNVKVVGMGATVPKYEESNWDYDLLTEKEQDLLVKTTGIEKRRIAQSGTTTSDLCYHSAKNLLSKLEWNSNEIELLIFVSQSPDYYLPATSIILQDRLGLPKTAIAFDINLGCSGFVYGLSVISTLISTARIKKALLFSGDVSSFSINKNDKSTFPLFGDAGTVTALEFDSSANPLYFNLQSDGSGYEAIIIPDGGLRNPTNDESYIEHQIEKGIKRSRRNLKLEGMDIFNFSLREVAPNINNLLEYANEDKSDFDYFVMHQANKLMNESIRKKLKIEKDKVPYSLAKFGNTSSASIPLTIVSELKNNLSKGKHKLILSGFGVGLSWASVLLDTNNLICTEVLEYE